MKAIHSAGAAALFAIMAACGNTADGARKDADKAMDKTAEAASKAGDKAVEAATKTGDAVSGAAETGQVKSALLANDLIDASNINVDTDEAKKTVTLKGTVPVESQKKLASDIAAAKATGYSVVNELTVKPK